jgi:hypothetical protein
MKRGALLAIIIFIILFLTSLYPFFSVELHTLSAQTELHNFQDGSSEKVIKVPDVGTSFYLELPANAEVIEATMNLSIVDYDSKYPFNPRLKLGTFQDWLWQYQRTGYGSFGNQYSFSDGSLSSELVYDGRSEYSDLNIYLPANAEVSSAKLNLTAVEYDYWNTTVQQLNLEPDGAGDYEPELIEFKNTMYATFRTYYNGSTNGSDSDIVITSSQNGINWTAPIEITNSPDSLPPYNESFQSADWRPTLETFNNRLYCAWESNSTSTSGEDHDILIRSSADGITWSNIINLTDQWENKYSNNTGSKNDWTVDMAVFNNSLWLIWATNNTGNETGFETPIGDIMLTNSSDGVNWNEPVELTWGDEWYTHDFYPQLAVFNNSLYAVWVSNNSKFSEDDSSDFDIVFQITYDGNIWKSLQSINPHDNDFLTGKGGTDTRPVLFTDSDKLFCVWMSAATYTHGSDMDIYMRYTTDGSFSEIGQQAEVTGFDNDYFDHSPEIIVFNNRLYVTWVTEIWVDDELVNSDIKINYFNLTTKQFGLQQQVNTDSINRPGFDYWPQLNVYKNKLYVAWDSNDTRMGTGLDRDIIITSNIPSQLSLEFGLDIGSDGIWEIPKTTNIDNNETTFELEAGIKDLLSNDTWVAKNIINNQYGFKMLKIPVKAYLTKPGKIQVEDLDIIYDCTLEVRDISSELNNYIDNAKIQQEVTINNTVIVPFSLTADTIGKIKVSDIEIQLDYKPEISLTNIPVNGVIITEPVFRITWDDFDPDSNATIDLYYDNDDRGFDGIPIISDLGEDSELDFYDWPWWLNEDLRSGGGGDYFVYANISDDRNYFLSYGAGPLKIQNIQIKEFLNVTLIEPDGIDDVYWDSFELHWRAYNSLSSAKIQFFIDHDNKSYDGKLISLNLTYIPPGSLHFIYAKITDVWNISVYNYSTGPLSRLYMPAPRNFTLMENLNPDAVNITTHIRTPNLKWDPPLDDNEFNISIADLEYTLKVWEGMDKTGIKVFDVETDKTTVMVKPSEPLQYGYDYYAEVLARSKPDQNESLANSLKFKLVNNLPGAPVIEITPDRPKTSSILTCNIVNESTDIDGDTVEYLYHWYKNDNRQYGYDNISVIPSRETAKGEVWQCVVTPYDNIEFGPSANFKVTIKNSAPTISVESPKAGKEYSEDDAIDFKFTVTDPDPGEANIHYIVYVENQGEKIASGYVESGTGEVEFRKKMSEGKYNIRINVTDGELSVEETIELDVAASEPDPLSSVLLPLFFGIIILIIMLAIIFFLLLTRIKNLKKGLGPADEAKVEEEEVEEESGVDEKKELDEEELDEFEDIEEIEPEEISDEELDEDFEEEEWEEE